MEFPRTSVITIQGGGAIAIDLVGQLQGLTGNGKGDRRLLPAAIAGTSAGAIIATLYWAGYTAEQIREEMVRLFARSRLDKFFGRPGRFQYPRFRTFAALGPLLGTLTFIWPLLCRRGLFAGEGMVWDIDKLLRESPLLKAYGERLRKDGLLRFFDVAQLNDSNTMPLFLIVTDVRQANILVVSSFDPNCENLEIARCARASGGFPGFFQPVRLSDAFDTCVDGGVISNFPAWVFEFGYRKSLLASGNDQLKQLAYLPWLHVGLRLAPDPAPSPARFIGFIRGLWGLLSGRARARLDEKLSAVVRKRRMVNPSLPGPGGAPRGVLDFQALSNPRLVATAFERGRIDGQQTIEDKCFQLPDNQELKPVLTALADSAGFLLREWLTPGSKVRANIFLPHDEEEGLALVYHAYMDGDPDEFIRFSSKQGISSLVFSTRSPVVADLRNRVQSVPGAQAHDLYLTESGAPAILKDRTWLFSIPLIDVTEMWPATPTNGPFSYDLDGPTLGVLNVDASIDYDKPNPPTPNRAGTHPAVLALFDGMKSTALRCSMILNKRFLV